jgi:hypothetical protein
MLDQDYGSIRRISIVGVVLDISGCGFDKLVSLTSVHCEVAGSKVNSEYAGVRSQTHHGSSVHRDMHMCVQVVLAISPGPFTR